ncbi:hypothetical protein [Tsukamurella paurometabola]|uniref:Uncharacterized protein n=1 Tax=Tsukamurella paurometabola TaxID=2061 RepID=A0A3P8JZU4_TSUPA|nr:hypothetical protein [Tsukamurella paurometabola]UEA81785.1 hypothetical protein LK411_15505 [Tsukamurella paurometabola]VDR38799.1 Uncharacterised protein [Tsukamurella paurometabola]
MTRQRPGDAGYMQPPSGGCDYCGGEVRRYRPGLGWVCHRCVSQARKDQER